MNSGSSPADLLGAASLLLAALAVLYSVWYSTIEAAKELLLPKHRGDATQPLEYVETVLHGRAYPLALASGLSTLVFGPEAINIVITTSESFDHHGLGAFGFYDPIEAALLLVTIGLFVLTIHVLRLCAALRKKLDDGAKLPP
ncbi:MAG TPA: hypothetical protein VF009_02710 [Solirubrobacterales bacterium]